jgi:hypothetical protein
MQLPKTQTTVQGETLSFRLGFRVYGLGFKVFRHFV